MRYYSFDAFHRLHIDSAHGVINSVKTLSELHSKTGWRKSRAILIFTAKCLITFAMFRCGLSSMCQFDLFMQLSSSK